ncbi:MAG TPA: hypothetical protein VLC71_13130 [Thermomonas sp.]|nr:hypothetical protein [Thermomonas sp.]
MPRLACVSLLALLLGLAGCSTTVFESIPTGATTDCDPTWPGRWEPVGTADDPMKPQGAVEIAADCRSETTTGETKPLHLTLIETRAGQYLQVHNDSGKPDCAGDGNTHCGATLLRYERDGDSIRLYEPDHAWIAAAIKAKKIDGHSARADTQGLKTKEPTYRNFIAGDGKRIATLLRKHRELFTTEPLMVLRRVPAGAAPTADAVPAPAREP